MKNQSPLNRIPQVLVDRNGRILKWNERFSQEGLLNEKIREIVSRNHKRILDAECFSHRVEERVYAVAVVEREEERLLLFFSEDGAPTELFSAVSFFEPLPRGEEPLRESCCLSEIRGILLREHPVLSKRVHWKMVGDLSLAVDPEEMLLAVLWLYLGFFFRYGAGTLCITPFEEREVCRLSVAFRREGRVLPLFPYEGEFPLAPFLLAPPRQTESGETELILPLQAEKRESVAFFAGERLSAQRVLGRLFPLSL